MLLFRPARILDLFRHAFISLVLGLAALPTASGQDTEKTYDVPGGSLEDALYAFASQAGVTLSFDPALVQGRTVPPIKGNYTVEGGLKRLLAGTRLAAIVNGPTVMIKPAPEPKSHSEALLPEVAVQADSPTGGDGTAESGYIVQKTSPVGPWEGRSLQDTPYSISVIPAQLIENVQAPSVDQLMRMNPTTQVQYPQSQSGTPGVTMRGFQNTSSVTAWGRNGIVTGRLNFMAAPEDVERIEVLTGFTGFTYGPGNVGGLVNMVLKRPTPERYNAVTGGWTGGQNGYLHGDFGGPIDADGRFGYRINAVAQDGDTWVDDQRLEKQLLSAAFDWRVTDDLLIQVDGAIQNTRTEGVQAQWFVFGVPRPSADSIDPKELWSQKWTFQDIESQRLGANLRYDLNDVVTFRAAYQSRKDYNSASAANNIVNADGSHDQSAYIFSTQKFSADGHYAFADIAFDTGSVKHKVTAGHLGRSNTTWYHIDDTAFAFFPGFSAGSPTHVPEPAWAPYGQGPMLQPYIVEESSWMVGDDIAFSERWSLLAGIAQSTIHNRERSAFSDPLETTYKESATTPTISLIFKPTAAITTYATYIEALEQGGVAGDVIGGFPVTNAGQVFAPMKSEQIELGAKANVGGMFLTAALFQIDKGLQYYDVTVPTSPTFVQDGRQVHRGIEFTATGNLTPSLTLFGGLTLLDAKVKEQKQNPDLEGKSPVEAAEQMFKLYAEYQVRAVPGLTLSGGFHYTGTAWADNLNTDELPSYTLFDAGARYMMDAGGYPLTLRFNVYNLGDKRYWVNSSYVGDPRTFMLSGTLAF